MSEGTALTPRSAALPAITTEQMVQALDKYREMQRALDQSMPDQIMNLDGKPFRKKGYWRAIALAFNLEVKKVEERREVAGKFNDGRDNFGYVVTYEAHHPSGRSMTGDGACFAVEKARRFKCPHPEQEGSKRTKHFPHNTCPDFDPEFQWKALPGEATEHNVRSHANTRAYNRAVSNLVGFGEVSAEEVEREEHGAREESSEPRRAGSGRSEGASQGGAAASQPAEGQPAGATKVKNVKISTGKNARGDWTKYWIQFEDGRSASTFSKTDGEHAQRAKDSGAHVIPDIKKEGDFFNLQGFQPWPKKEAEHKDEHPDPKHDDPVDGPEKILTIREMNTDAGKRWAIQTDKRVLLTDQETHVENAKSAREEGMGLTPKIEIVQGKNRLLGWAELGAIEEGQAQAKAEEEKPAEEKKEKPKRQKKESK